MMPIKYLESEPQHLNYELESKLNNNADLDDNSADPHSEPEEHVIDIKQNFNNKNQLITLNSVTK